MNIGRKLVQFDGRLFGARMLTLSENTKDFKTAKKKKRRLLVDELKIPVGQSWNCDTLKYSVTAKEFATMLSKFEEQHRDIVNQDKIGYSRE
jgi:hypothetical protein